eukprot:CAMPEP_0173265294 /NCGR_PEP_ID=MMETSP1142-20121109/28498_1 /TAXON_ID=483371 /ORGANISM="non described non described, Strain CCMP2298" /LENGTH=43 /DNA_ID= /DNA_START= /DNA_END= /DNA_ORIENTATION=
MTCTSSMRPATDREYTCISLELTQKNMPAPKSTPQAQLTAPVR